jgi:DNA-binding NarL/FixJ family response regulator
VSDGVIRILIVDDHPVVRAGLRGMIAGEPGFEVVGEAADGNAAVRQAHALRPDAVLMDLRMPGGDGVDAIARMSAELPDVHVLVLTTYDSDTDILRAVEAGATGYLLKDTPRDELFRAIRSAAAGQSVLAPSVAARLMERMRAPADEPLSARELDVLRAVARGASNREVADALFISEATVKTHLIHIFQKLGVADRTAAVTVALERGVLQL